MLAATGAAFVIVVVIGVAVAVAVAGVLLHVHVATLFGNCRGVSARTTVCCWPGY